MMAVQKSHLAVIARLLAHDARQDLQDQVSVVHCPRIHNFVGRINRTMLVVFKGWTNSGDDPTIAAAQNRSNLARRLSKVTEGRRMHPLMVIKVGNGGTWKLLEKN